MSGGESVRQRAREHVDLAENVYKGKLDTYGWAETYVTDVTALLALLESESSLARKQEREDNCKAVCSECKEDFYWSPAKLVHGKWQHFCLNLPGQSECKASAIHERGRKEQG